MEDELWWKEDDLNNEADLKNKEDLHIAGRHTALDIFSFAVFLTLQLEETQIKPIYACWN